MRRYRHAHSDADAARASSFHFFYRAGMPPKAVAVLMNSSQLAWVDILFFGQLDDARPVARAMPQMPARPTLLDAMGPRKLAR